RQDRRRHAERSQARQERHPRLSRRAARSQRMTRVGPAGHRCVCARHADPAHSRESGNPGAACTEAGSPPSRGRAGPWDQGERAMDILYKIFIDPFVQMGTSPDLLAQTLWDGLVAGVLYALIALGFVLIFKASGVFNFAQGIMVVFAALTLVGLHERGVPAFVALALTVIVMLAL